MRCIATAYILERAPLFPHGMQSCIPYVRILRILTLLGPLPTSDHINPNINVSNSSTQRRYTCASVISLGHLLIQILFFVNFFFLFLLVFCFLYLPGRERLRVVKLLTMLFMIFFLRRRSPKLNYTHLIFFSKKS